MKNYLINSLALFLLLTTLQSCEKKEEKPSPPYYQFSAADLQWTKLRQGDRWNFENSSGERQQYIIESIEEKIKGENRPSNFGGIISGSQPVTYFYDEVVVNIKRLDSLDYNSLNFKKGLPLGTDQRNPPLGNGEFKFGGRWGNYIGGFIYQEIFGNINVSSDQLELRNSLVLTVNGKSYDNVIVINGVPNILVFKKSYIKTIYYAQREGIIRMISRSGEVWNRVP